MKPGPCTVYFMQPSGGGHIKIGATSRPEFRHKQIAALFPYGIDVIATLDGDDVTETFLHTCFGPTATATEWFKSTPAIWRFMLDVTDNGRPAFVPAGFLADRHEFRAAVATEFGTLEEAKRRLGYAPSTLPGQTFSMYGTNRVARARFAFHMAFKDGSLPEYIRALHGAEAIAPQYSEAA